MKIRDMTLLVRVADTGSMTLAARQLHLTPAAVSAAVLRIESALGVRLFERTTRTLHPTDEGLAVVEGCRAMVELWRRTLDNARGHSAEPEGTVRLSAPADTTYQLLGAVVARLCAQHPKLRVVLDTSDAVQHLHRDAIDLAIRYGPLQDSALTARKLAEAPLILVASPSYLDQHPAPATPDALAHHRCVTLHLSGTPRVAWRLSSGAQTHTVPLNSPLCGDGHMARIWALEGVGIAFKSLFDVIEDLEEGRLIHVLPVWRGAPMPIHAVFPSRRFLPARVRAVDAAITAAFDARSERCRAWLDASERVPHP